MMQAVAPAARDAELAALRAEVERLKAERDAALAEGAVIGRMNAMKDAEAQIGRLREALLDATANLAGAASAYEKHASRNKSVGRAVPDPLFSTRAQDFHKATERARAALEPKP